MDDAGILTCSVQEIGRQPDQYRAQLIVLGKPENHETTVFTLNEIKIASSFQILRK